MLHLKPRSLAALLLSLSIISAYAQRTQPPAEMVIVDDGGSLSLVDPRDVRKTPVKTPSTQNQSSIDTQLQGGATSSSPPAVANAGTAGPLPDWLPKPTEPTSLPKNAILNVPIVVNSPSGRQVVVSP